MTYEEKSYLIDRLWHKVIQCALLKHRFSSFDQYTPIPTMTEGLDGKPCFAICILGGVGSKVEDRVNGYWPINNEADFEEASTMWRLYLTSMQEMKKDRSLN